MEYNNEEKIIEYFNSVIKKDSGKDIKKLRESTNLFIIEETKKIEAEINYKYKIETETLIYSLNIDKMIKINEIRKEHLNEITKHRMSIIDNVFLEITSRINQFVKTKKYDKYLEEKNALIKNNYKNLKYKISKNDDTAKKILSKHGDVFFDEDIKVGGFILFNDEIELDFTFDSKLIKEKESFYQNIDLTLNVEDENL